MKLDILACGVHPDDVELSCGGTLLKHIDLGYKVGICDLTRGELGSRGSAELRLKEAEAAKNILGALIRENLGMADGFFIHSEENIKLIATCIRRYKPEIVFANAPSDRHPDHGRASKLVSDACFYSGLQKIEISDGNGGYLSPWRPKAVYHYIQDRNLKPDFVVDISPYVDKKFEAIMAFSSQFYNPDSEEPSTPISSKEFIEFMKTKNRFFGRDINVAFAEGFITERTLGVENVLHLI